MIASMGPIKSGCYTVTVNSTDDGTASVTFTDCTVIIVGKADEACAEIDVALIEDKAQPIEMPYEGSVARPASDRRPHFETQWRRKEERPGVRSGPY